MSNHASSNWHIERSSAGLNYCSATDRCQLVQLRHVDIYRLRSLEGFLILNYKKRRTQKRTLARNNDTNGFEPAGTRPCAARYSAVQTANYYGASDRIFWGYHFVYSIIQKILRCILNLVPVPPSSLCASQTGPFLYISVYILSTDQVCVCVSLPSILSRLRTSARHTKKSLDFSA